MANLRLTVNRAGVRALLTSPEVQADLAARAARVAAAAGPGHLVDTRVGRNRARAAVITDTPAAMVNEARHRNLTRAIDAARG